MDSCLTLLKEILLPENIGHKLNFMSTFSLTRNSQVNPSIVISRDVIIML